MKQKEKIKAKRLMRKNKRALRLNNFKKFEAYQQRLAFFRGLV